MRSETAMGGAETFICQKGGVRVGTCADGGGWAPGSLGRAAQRGSPSEVIAGLTAVEHFLPRGKAVLVAGAVLAMQDLWRPLTNWGKSRHNAPVSDGLNILC